MSPHVRSWSERITVDAAPADFEAALARVRPQAEAQGATQFETLCAAAFAEFAAVASMSPSSRRGWAAGSTRPTSSAATSFCSRTSASSTRTCSGRRARRSPPRSSRSCRRGRSPCSDGEFADLAGPNVVVGGAREAAAAFLGRALEREVEISLPGRLERREGGEIRDGAHNPDGARWLAAQLERSDYTVVASILRDKHADAMLTALATRGRRLIATTSTNGRALGAEELARLAAAHFDDVEVEPDPLAALERARRHPPVLVTGSLYLLADLEAASEERAVT